MATWTIAKSNIHINDSCDVSKKDFESILNVIRSEVDEKKIECDVTENRSNCSMKLEWASHNFLYSMGIAVERTHDVDLDYPQKWYYGVGYAILGVIGWIFIK